MAANDPARRNYQVAADSEAGTIEHKREHVHAHYARWCPYMQHFCKAWSMFGKEVDDRSIDKYLACCQETTETIREALQGGFLDADHIAHLNASLEFFEATMVQMQFCQDRARRTKEEREREEEREIALCERLQQQTDDDFWEEYDRCMGQSPDPLERKVHMEERARRKLKQQQESRQGSWKDQPMMEGEDPRASQEERSRHNDMKDWQAQRWLSRSALQRMIQEMVEEGAGQSEKTVMSGNEPPSVHLHDAINF